MIGNFTSRIPANKPGVVIDPNQNYSGQPKPQDMVVESNPPQVKPSDINVDKKALFTHKILNIITLYLMRLRLNTLILYLNENFLNI